MALNIFWTCKSTHIRASVKYSSLKKRQIVSWIQTNRDIQLNKHPAAQPSVLCGTVLSSRCAFPLFINCPQVSTSYNLPHTWNRSQLRPSWRMWQTLGVQKSHSRWSLSCGTGKARFTGVASPPISWDFTCLNHVLLAFIVRMVEMRFWNFTAALVVDWLGLWLFRYGVNLYLLLMIQHSSTQVIFYGNCNILATFSVFILLPMTDCYWL